MAESYDAIVRYLERLRSKYHVQICIKDFSGFVPISKDLDEALRPFLAHTNDFCMYMKSNSAHWHTCLSMIRGIYNKCQELRRPYFGICHAGLGEYVIPIFNEDNLLGSINAGFFPVPEGRTIHRICRSCAKAPALNAETAVAIYYNTIETPTIDPEEMIPCLELLAEYLGQTYSLLQKTHSHADHRYRASSEELILTHALEYIRERAITPITVTELADFCHCSESYLSRVFKRGTGVNINVYINKIRIEEAKNYLIYSQMRITDIASSVGFNDANYFSRVFTKIIGISPSEYRRRFQQEPK